MDDSLKLNVSDLWCPVLEEANFPIFSPKQLLSGLKLMQASFRPENSKRLYPRCSLKLILEDEDVGKKGSTIQLQHVHKDSPAACAFPPVPDATQKFKVKLEKVCGVDCYYAYRSESYGPHELVFQIGDFNYLMLVKSASWTSREWFFNLLGNFFRKYSNPTRNKHENWSDLRYS